VDVTINGTSIPLAPVTTQSAFAVVLGGDVSHFAGQVVELRFTAPKVTAPGGCGCGHWRSIFLLDNIRFSTSTVSGAPVILSPPVSQTAEIGSSIAFAVSADGKPSMTYQWFFEWADAIGGATTNAGLMLTNVNELYEGAYWVVVSNAFGTAISAPAMLSIIPAVERQMVPAIGLSAQPASVLNLECASAFGSSPAWTIFATVYFTNSPQFVFDLSAPPLSQRFYRAWHTNSPAPPTSLDLHFVPALSLAGTTGSTVRVDYINQFGPIDAWVNLAAVTLTNTSQLYFDTSSIGQPPRLWRVR
jgi:hypothetical protein